MTTLKVGIASYEDMKARTMAVARGEQRIAPDEPKVWFTSTEFFAKVLSAGNRDLLRVIVEQAPGSLDELARITGKAKSNLSRTLRTMAGYGLVRLERGERGRITPKVTHDRVELDLPLWRVGGGTIPFMQRYKSGRKHNRDDEIPMRPSPASIAGAGPLRYILDAALRANGGTSCRHEASRDASHPRSLTEFLYPV